MKTAQGQKVENPSSEEVEHMLFDDPATWTYSPHTTLSYTDGTLVSKLLIAHSDEHGYHVHLLDSMRQMWLLVPNRDNINPDIVEIDAGYRIAAGLFSDKQLTWAAVKWFMMHGTPAPDLTWISDHEIPDGIHF